MQLARADQPGRIPMRSLLNQKAHPGDYMNTGSLTDRELFTRIAAGDEDALGALYQRYHLDVYRFALSRIQDEPGAEEILQDVFVAAWQRAGSFRGTASVKTWLLRVTYYRAATWLNTRRETVALEHAEQVPARAVHLDERIEKSWQSDQVRESLAALTEKHRTALELIFFFELSYREAARVVGCPVGTMKSRVSHALDHLNGLLIKAGLDQS